MTTSARSEQTIRNHITQTLKSELPQIQMHGGNSEIVTLDVDDGHAEIALGGHCTGCGLSSMTIQALQNCLTNQVPELTTVEAHTRLDTLGDGARGDSEDAPF